MPQGQPTNVSQPQLITHNQSPRINFKTRCTGSCDSIFILKGCMMFELFYDYVSFMIAGPVKTVPILSSQRSKSSEKTVKIKKTKSSKIPLPKTNTAQCQNLSSVPVWVRLVGPVKTLAAKRGRNQC